MQLSKKDSKGANTNLTLIGKSSNASILLNEDIGPSRKEGKVPTEETSLMLDEALKDDRSQSAS